MTVIVDKKCIGCGSCIQVCPEGALDMGPDNIVVVDANKCTNCGKCTCGCCPVEALSLPVTQAVATPSAPSGPVGPAACDMPLPVSVDNSRQGQDLVWVYAEHMEGKIAGVTLELIGAGCKLAEKRGAKLAVILVGDNVECHVAQLFEYGADKVYMMESPVYHFYRTEAYLKACVYLVQKYKPEILLIGATTTGRDLAGAVATELKTGLTADCTQLDIDTDKMILLASRPAFGGNIMATILCEHHQPQMATVRPKVMQALPPMPGRIGELIKEYVEIREEDIPKQVLEIVLDQAENVKLDEAKIIVSGGRGVKEKNGFQMLQDLADVLGGVVGGSRGAVECGCITTKRQVGQTGQTVAPGIYFAIGISGAIQHVVGMQRSEIIIAINTDPNCEMMKMATYSIVGDAYQIVPKLVSEFRHALSKRTPAETVDACAVVPEANVIEGVPHG